MDLILWRHAEAEELTEGLTDAKRSLTKKGQRQAERMAEWLNHHLPETTRVLASPAQRAQQTADTLGRRFKTSKALAPEGTVEALLDSARWPDAREPVLVIGHQPVLGLTVAYLLAGALHAAQPGSEVLPWSIKKGGIWWLRHRQHQGRSEIAVVAALSAEML